MENLGYLVAAYAIVWLGLVAYVAWMGSQQAALDRDLRAMREALAEHERPAQG